MGQVFILAQLPLAVGLFDVLAMCNDRKTQGVDSLICADATGKLLRPVVSTTGYFQPTSAKKPF
jgi:hypothetical protein